MYTKVPESVLDTMSNLPPKVTQSGMVEQATRIMQWT